LASRGPRTILYAITAAHRVSIAKLAR
jgi:hypothetical protein